MSRDEQVRVVLLCKGNSFFQGNLEVLLTREQDTVLPGHGELVPETLGDIQSDHLLLQALVARGTRIDPAMSRVDDDCLYIEVKQVCHGHTETGKHGLIVTGRHGHVIEY